MCLNYTDPEEVPWIAHLLWLRAGKPEGGSREFHPYAHGIAVHLFSAPELSQPVAWSCGCGLSGYVNGPVDAAARELRTVQVDHAGHSHRLLFDAGHP